MQNLHSGPDDGPADALDEMQAERAERLAAIDVVADDLIALKGCTFVRYSDGWRTHACTDFRVINDLLVTQGRSHDFLRTIVDGQAVPWARVCGAAVDAYIAASTVRFEHGESP